MPNVLQLRKYLHLSEIKYSFVVWWRRITMLSFESSLCTMHPGHTISVIAHVNLDFWPSYPNTATDEIILKKTKHANSVSWLHCLYFQDPIIPSCPSQSTTWRESAGSLVRHSHMGDTRANTRKTWSQMPFPRWKCLVKDYKTMIL